MLPKNQGACVMTRATAGKPCTPADAIILESHGVWLGPWPLPITDCVQQPRPCKPTVPRLPGGGIVFETLIALSWPVLHASHEAIPSETSAAFCRSDEFPLCGLRPLHPRHPVKGGSGPRRAARRASTLEAGSRPTRFRFSLGTASQKQPFIP